jgi:hypothetical protein
MACSSSVHPGSAAAKASLSPTFQWLISIPFLDFFIGWVHFGFNAGNMYRALERPHMR